MNHKLKTKILMTSAFFLFIFMASFSAVSAKGLIPDCGANCGFNDLMQLARNVMNYLIMISIPLAALSFAAAGFLIVTAAGDESKIKKGKEIFGKVAIGFIFVLGAWLIVYTITIALLNPNTAQDYNLLK